jgi:plastocyanin
MYRRVLAILSTAIVFIVPTITTGSVAGGSPEPAKHESNLVRLLGTETFEANTLIQATFRFSPERLFPHSGESVRWIDQDKTEDPHTITVVRRSQLPTSVPEVFQCEACNAALDAHFSSNPPKVRVNVGAPGLDQPGDSLLLLPDASIGAQVTADPGTRLYYLCSIHAWMQGKLVVG